MKNQQFSDSYEELDYNLIVDFNSVLKLNDLGRCPYQHHTDASGTTTDGRECGIEIKRRNQALLDNLTISGKTYTASTIYIEQHKMADLLLDYIYDRKEPLYINFLENDTVIVFNLTRLSCKPNKTCKKIWSELYQGFELAKRLELKLEDAWIYRKIDGSYKIIHKPSRN